MRSPSVWLVGSCGRTREDVGDEGSDWRVDRARRRGVGAVEAPEVRWGAREDRDRLEALRDGGPRKREGGGAR